MYERNKLREGDAFRIPTRTVEDLLYILKISTLTAQRGKAVGTVAQEGLNHSLEFPTPSDVPLGRSGSKTTYKTAADLTAVILLTRRI